MGAFMPDRDWILRKCDAYREGWRRNFASLPGHVNTALGVSVAWHETRCGDAWPGEFNWGATTLRSLNSAEQWLLATHALSLLIDAKFSMRGDRLRFDNFKYSWERYQQGGAFDIVAMQTALELTPDGVFGAKSKAALGAWKAEYPQFPPELMWPMVRERLPLNSEEREIVRSVTPSTSNGHAARAAEAMRVLQESTAGTGYALPKAVIHCDSTPERGPYFVWFRKGDDDTDGAAYFVRLLAGSAEKPRASKAVLLRNGTPYELAEAMYAQSYYTGFFKRDEIYPDGKTGRQKNIDAYAGRIAANYPTVLATLKSRGDDAADTEPMMAAMSDTEQEA
jgi:hypothetical protein